MVHAYNNLLHEFANTLRHTNPPADDFTDDLLQQRTAVPIKPQTDVRALAHLPTLLQKDQHDPLRPLADAIGAVTESLSWTPFYRRSALTEGFVDAFAVTEVIGPSGPLISDNLIMFMFVMDAHTIYPLHWHAAEELYFVLSGTPAYQVGNQAWQTRHPGDVVHVPSYVPHAIHNADDPMLVLQVWRGAIQEKPLFPVDSDGRASGITTADVQ